MLPVWGLVSMLRMFWCQTQQSHYCWPWHNSYFFACFYLFICNWATHLGPHAILMEIMALNNDNSTGGHSVAAHIGPDASLRFFSGPHPPFLVTLLHVALWICAGGQGTLGCIILGHCDETRRWNVCNVISLFSLALSNVLSNCWLNIKKVEKVV